MRINAGLTLVEGEVRIECLYFALGSILPSCYDGRYGEYSSDGVTFLLSVASYVQSVLNIKPFVA